MADFFPKKEEEEEKFSDHGRGFSAVAASNNAIEEGGLFSYTGRGKRRERRPK